LLFPVCDATIAHVSRAFTKNNLFAGS